MYISGVHYPYDLFATKNHKSNHYAWVRQKNELFCECFCIVISTEISKDIIILRIASIVRKERPDGHESKAKLKKDYVIDIHYSK